MRAGRDLRRRACIVAGGRRHPDTRFPGDGPASSADSAHSNDAQRVLHPLGRRLGAFGKAGQRTGPPPPAGSRAPPSLASRQSIAAAVAPAKQRLLHTLHGPSRGFAGLARVLHVVIYALRNQNQIREAKVDSEGDDGGDKAGPDCASEVRNVADEPNGEEGERYAFC